MNPILDNPRCIKLTPAQTACIASQAFQLKALMNKRDEFLKYLLEEHGSHEHGPFEFIDGYLVPQDLLPSTIKLS